MDMFEKATRNKLRFESSIGNLTVEQIWDLPLTSKNDRPNLDGLARAVNLELKNLDEVSFVETKPNPRKTELELRLDILKHIIAFKLAERSAAEKAAENAERKRRLMAALSAKEDAALAGMSKEEIEAEIAKLTA
jgi:hypothetical protein